jgi:hypothetical protein
MRRASGNINVARSIFEHPMFADGKPLSRREAWIWLIANAAWRPMDVQVRSGRSQQIIKLERGQLTYARSFLKEAWNWSCDKVVRTFLQRLQREHMVDLLTGQPQTVISICNYDVFQNGGNAEGPAKRPAKGQQRASKGPEEENIKNIISIKRKTEAKASAPNGAGEVSEASVYKFGKALLGSGAGGQITKLRKLFRNDWGKVHDVLLQAAEKGDSRAWIAGVLKGSEFVEPTEAEICPPDVYENVL